MAQAFLTHIHGPSQPWLGGGSGISVISELKMDPHLQVSIIIGFYITI